MKIEDSGRRGNGFSRIMRVKWFSGAAVFLAVGALAGVSMVWPGPTEPAFAAADSVPVDQQASGGPLTFRRLNESQYKQSIVDIFGEGITVPGRFDPVVREEGLLAIGESRAGLSSSGLEQYELRARDIAAQVLGEEKRKTYLSCEPASLSGFDQACASQFLSKYGRMLYRRPLSQAELASVMAVSKAGATMSQSFYRGLEVGLARLLYSPNFVFRVARAEPDPNRAGAQRLDAYSLASRISFLLWNAPPDEILLNAAESGALHQPAELEKQVDRLIGSPRFNTGVRAFFSDMLGFDQFVGLSKDQSIFKKFTSQMANDAREQALRTIVDLLVTNQSDYRDLFTTRKTFINRNLGALYEIPIENGAGVEGWTPYTFEEADRRKGLLTFAGILMLDPTHEGRSSPTNRGKLVREALMCQPVPAPPVGIDFTTVQDINNAIHRTARDRLTIHQESPVCAGCHAITDPIGLSMENYDALGAYRTHENGALIDASGELEGKSYDNAIELAQILHDSPAVPECLVKRTYEYGVGRQATSSEEAWLESANAAFASDKYKVPDLMRRIATSKSFQAVANQQMAAK